MERNTLLEAISAAKLMDRIRRRCEKMDGVMAVDFQLDDRLWDRVPVVVLRPEAFYEMLGDSEYEYIHTSTGPIVMTGRYEGFTIKAVID